MDSDERPLPGGTFSTWLAGIAAVLEAGGDMDVPCGDCTACCRSSQFVHVERDETATLSQIPEELLFPAPGEPRGNWLMGYNEQGHCPMLVENRCSIYADRPRACRSYDCRIFAATGVDNVQGPLIARQAARWRFDLDDDQDRLLQGAVQAATDFLGRHPECFAGGSPSHTQTALLAIKAHGIFTPQTHRDDPNRAPDDAELAQAVAAIQHKP